MLTHAWHMLRDGAERYDLGAAHFDRTDAAKTANRLVRRLQQIGYVVQAQPAGGKALHFSVASAAIAISERRRLRWPSCGPTRDMSSSIS